MDSLKPADIPSPSATWTEIGEFALTFNGYEYWGSFAKCAEIANARDPQDLLELRTCLFFEQRRFRHFGWAPDGEDMDYIRGLVELVREFAEAKQTAE